MSPLFVAAQRRQLGEADLLGVAGTDHPAVISRTFQRLLRERLGTHGHPVQSALVAQFYGPMLVAGMLRFINSTLNFAPSLLLYGLLSSMQKGSGTLFQNLPDWSGWMFAALMFASLALRTCVENAMFQQTARVGFNVRCALQGAVYQKALRLSSASRQESPVGQIVNLMQIDAMRLDSLMMNLHSLWDAWYQILGYLALLGFFIGPSCLAGLLAMLCMMPTQVFFMKVGATCHPACA